MARRQPVTADAVPAVIPPQVTEIVTWPGRYAVTTPGLAGSHPAGAWLIRAPPVAGP